MTQEAQPSKDEIREGFEKHAASIGLDLRRYKGGKYFSNYTTEHWVTWHYAASTSHAGLREELERAKQILGKPRCLDCNRSGLTNCSHFDNCAGQWKYAIETRAETAESTAARLEAENAAMKKRLEGK